MPIKNLTSKRTTPGLARAGVIRLGYKAKKCKCGNITGPLDNTDNCPQCGERLGDSSFPRESPHFILKDAPGVTDVLGSAPTELKIYFPFDTVDEVFPHFMQLWSASSLLCRGDGEHILHAIERTTGKANVRDGVALQDFTEGKANYVAGQVMACPGTDRNLYPKCKDCKPGAMLIVMLRDIPRLAYYQITTGSINNILSLPEQIEYVRELVFRLTGQARITGVPFILRRVEKTVSVPNLDKNGKLKKDKNGKTLPPKQRVKKYFLELEIEAEWMQQLGQALTRQSSPALAIENNPPQLAPGSVSEPPTWEGDDDSGVELEIIEVESDPTEPEPGLPPERPWAPEYLREHFPDWVDIANRPEPPTEQELVALKGCLAALAAKPEKVANMVAYLTEKQVDQLNAGEVEVLVRWLKCDDEGQPDFTAIEEVKAILALDDVFVF